MYAYGVIVEGRFTVLCQTLYQTIRFEPCSGKPGLDASTTDWNPI